MAEHLESGRAAERLARAHLERHGLVWVDSNFRCRFGELDLVMTDGDTLVVVEVRYRRRTDIMDPRQSITPDKLRRIVLATQLFIRQHRRWREHAVRFDVVGLRGPLPAARMDWVRGAFPIEDLSDSEGP